MIELIKFIVGSITGKDDIEVVENELDDGRFEYVVKVPKDLMGIVIGKGGSTVKALRNLIKVKATIEKKSVNIFVEELS
jgi:predicted RNA-binding protein YlqC (UPF0109 family)